MNAKKKKKKKPTGPDRKATMKFLETCRWYDTGQMHGPLSFRQYLGEYFQRLFDTYPPTNLSNSDLNTIIGYRLQIDSYTIASIPVPAKIQQNYKAGLAMIKEGEKAIPKFHSGIRGIIKAEKSADNLTEEETMTTKKVKKAKAKKERKGSKRQTVCELLLKNNQAKLTDGQIADAINKVHKDGEPFTSARVAAYRNKLNAGKIGNFPAPKTPVECTRANAAEPKADKPKKKKKKKKA